MTPDPTLIEQERPRCKMPDCDEPVYQLGVCSHHWEWLNGREPAATLQGSAALPSETMIEAGLEALREHTDRYFDGSEVVREGAVEAIYTAMRATTPIAPASERDPHKLRVSFVDNKPVKAIIEGVEFSPTAPSEATKRMAKTLGCEFVPKGTAPVQDDEPMLTPEEEAELVERINGTPNLQPVQDDDAELVCMELARAVDDLLSVADNVQWKAIAAINAFSSPTPETGLKPGSYFEAMKAATDEIARLKASETGLVEALRPFAALARKKTWPDAPGETGLSPLDEIEGKNGTGELYLGTHFGTDRTITLFRDDFERALASLSNVLPDEVSNQR